MDSLKLNDSTSQDPDYFTPVDRDLQSQNIIEENVRDTANKISAILETEFSKEIDAKKQEVFSIYKNLNKACKMLHYLRFAIVTDFYNRESLRIDDTEFKQSRLHSTVNAATKKVFNCDVSDMNECFQKMLNEKRQKRINHDESDVPVKKCLKSDVPVVHSTGSRGKIKKRIVIANISQWIPPDSRENNSATHKWTIFIRDSEKSDCSQFISKVRYFLHPSYKPNDVIELTSAPFDLSRLGWGEFPARIQLHFSNNLNKPVDIIHHIKLDRTFTRLKTIGSQTVVDIWLTNTGIQSDYGIEEVCAQETQNKNIIEESGEKDTNLSEIRLKDDTKEIKIPNLWHLYNDHNYIGRNFKFHEHFHHKFEKSQESENLISDNNKIAKENLVHKPQEHKGLSLLKSKQNNFNDSLTTFDKLSNDKGTRHILVHDKHHLLYKENLPDNLDGQKFYIQQENKVDDNINDYKKIINLVQHIQPKTLFNILKIIVPKIPLITEKSTNPVYKVAHPYATESYQVFSKYTEVKQSSLERCQALHVLDILRTAKSDMVCSVKELMIWARRYGYTPVLNINTMHKLCISDTPINIEEDVKKYECTSTVSNQLSKWLSGCQKTIPLNRNLDNDHIEVIDVLNDLPSPSNSMRVNSNCKEGIIKDKSKLELFKYEKHNSLSDFVCKTTQKIGIKLVNEEIIPNALHNSANLVIAKAVECMIDDLVRLSFSCALDRCNAQKDSFSVEYEDVRMALLKREEFDLFTNAGLGSEG